MDEHSPENDAPTHDAYAAFRDGAELLLVGTTPTPRSWRWNGPARSSPTRRRSARRWPGPTTARAVSPPPRAEFARAVELDPVNDYAHFGLGLSLLRTGDRLGARRPPPARGRDAARPRRVPPRCPHRAGRSRRCRRRVDAVTDHSTTADSRGLLRPRRCAVAGRRADPGRGRRRRRACAPAASASLPDNNSSRTRRRLRGQARVGSASRRPRRRADQRDRRRAARSAESPRRRARARVRRTGVVEALEPTASSRSTPRPADAVVVGWHRDFDFDRLDRACRRDARRGARSSRPTSTPRIRAPDGLLPGDGAHRRRGGDRGGAQARGRGQARARRRSRWCSSACGDDRRDGGRPAVDRRRAGDRARLAVRARALRRRGQRAARSAMSRPDRRLRRRRSRRARRRAPRRHAVAPGCRRGPSRVVGATPPGTAGRRTGAGARCAWAGPRSWRSANAMRAPNTNPATCATHATPALGSVKNCMTNQIPSTTPAGR